MMLRANCRFFNATVAKQSVKFRCRPVSQTLMTMKDSRECIKNVTIFIFNGHNKKHEMGNLLIINFVFRYLR